MTHAAGSGDVPGNDFARARGVRPDDMQLFSYYGQLVHRAVLVFFEISQPRLACPNQRKRFEIEGPVSHISPEEE